MSFQRVISAPFQQLLKQYPVVTVTGPRQSGKTTLVQNLCKDYAYINLEDPEIREIAIRDPRAIFSKYPNRLIIDEIQHAPKLLSYIQVIVDQAQQEGMFVLTGSHQPALHEAVGQSLAGRTALLQLLPMCLKELAEAKHELSLNEQMLTGFYPRIYQKNLDPTQFYRDYMKTYIERDVREMIHLKDLMTFQRFMKLLASRTGCILNMSSFSDDIGVSSHTIKHWLSILQASYLVDFVMPYFENFGKQVVKSPKIYFTDVGLAAYLLGIETSEQLDRDPLRGNLFETMVVTELIKTKLNQGKDPHLYYYRDSQKKEIDIIYKSGDKLVPIEIKSAQTIHHDFFKGLDYFSKLAGERSVQAYLVYSGDQEYRLGQCNILNYRRVDTILTS